MVSPPPPGPDPTPGLASPPPLCSLLPPCPLWLLGTGQARTHPRHPYSGTLNNSARPPRPPPAHPVLTQRMESLGHSLTVGGAGASLRGTLTAAPPPSREMGAPQWTPVGQWSPLCAAGADTWQRRGPCSVWGAGRPRETLKGLERRLLPPPHPSCPRKKPGASVIVTHSPG